MASETKGKAPDQTQFILSHGDKGGVGKSMLAMAIADILISRGRKVAILDADTRNPDVARMYNDTVPTARMNLRSEDGWMDVMDFVDQHPEHTIVMSLPAGIGEYMQNEIEEFCTFLAGQERKPEIELWWTINLLPDSVNLLDDGLKRYGKFFARTRVVRNLFHSQGDPSQFIFWNESPLKTRVERSGGMTLDFPALHLRIMSKLFQPSKMMPFTSAMDAAIGEAVGLTNSERFKLKYWFDEVAKQLSPALNLPLAQA